MTWQIDFSRESLRFMKSNNLGEEAVISCLEKAMRKLKGEKINVDIKKMKGSWLGFHRIRIAQIRILAQFDFEQKRIYIDRIDFRGDVYK